MHAGLEIKRTSTREADGTSGDRWVIQTPENADRKARGERQIGGDRLVNSIDQAKQVAEEMRQQAETDASRAAKFDRQDSEQKAADDARKAKNKGKTIADIRAASALDKMVRDDGQAITRRAWVEKRIAAGDVAKVEQEDKIKPMTRQQFNRASNEEQRAHDRRIQEAGKKDAYWLGNYEVTKAEYDYAELLSASAPVVAAVGTPAVAPAAPAPDVQPSDNLAAAGQAQPAVDAETAATAPAATISPTPEKPKRPIAAQRAADTRASALADYFATGNVVKSYGGFDEVLALKQSEDGSFSVKVHSVTKDQSGQWVRQGKPQDARWHSTSPDANELKAGPVAGSLPHMRGDLVGYTEGRADGQPFKNAPDRGIAPSVKAALPDAKPAPVEDRPAPSKAKPATKADALTQTFDQWAQATLDASEYEGVYRESAGGNEKLAGLMAVNGDPDGDPKQMLAQARSQYWRDIMSSPREASLSLDVLESLPSAQQYDAQRHFYDLDGRIAGKTQDETKAQVKAEGEKRKPYEDALAEVEAEIKRLDARNGPITAKQNELSARSDRLREAIYQIGRGNTPDGRLLKKTNAGPAAQAEIAAPYTALEGRMIEQPIEAEGASVVRRRDAAKALRKLDEREAGLKSLLKCLKGGG